MDTRLDGPKSRSERCEKAKNLLPCGGSNPTIQAVTHRYTDSSKSLIYLDRPAHNGFKNVSVKLRTNFTLPVNAERHFIQITYPQQR
jgi:hypothetical protein